MWNVETVLKHYLIALVWSSLDYENADEPGEPIPLDELTDGYTPRLIEASRADIAALIEMATEVEISGADWWTDEQFGHDFALTRNGHGAGFWDRGQGAAGDALTTLAKTFGEVNAWNNAGKADLV